MTVVLVHGLPETAAVWEPLRAVLPVPSVAVALPGFGAPVPDGWTGTKDELARWLDDELARIGPPIDLVAHDLGALLTMRLATAGRTPLASWTVDVADLFAPDAEWAPWHHRLQTPGDGERALAERAATPGAHRRALEDGGVPAGLATRIAAAHDSAMDRAILAFYRSAVPVVAADWWPADDERAQGRGLVLLLPDPPEVEARAVRVAQRLGAATARLDSGHAWMAKDPERVLGLLTDFWAGGGDAPIGSRS